MVETKTLVVDVDDTISTHVNRNYDDAIPHLDIIKKLNDMHDAGWRIVYFTARGQVSCNGDVTLIEKSRRPALENWMKKHNVKYAELIFGKPLGVYYIDDKSLRPDEFMALEYKKYVGGSGGTIERLGNRLIKKADNVKEQAEWYRLSEGLCDTPKINTVYGNTLDIEFIDGPSLNSVCKKRHLDTLVGVINNFSNVPAITPDWDTMVDRLRKHVSLNAICNEAEIIKLMGSDEVGKFMNVNASFCHGDMTLENCIVRNERVYLIDPNLPPNLYSSWLLDVGKLYQSLHFGYEEKFSGYDPELNKTELFFYLRSQFDEKYHPYFLLCELVHYIRMLKYKGNEQKAIVRNIIDQIYQEVKKCF